MIAREFPTPMRFIEALRQCNSPEEQKSLVQACSFFLFLQSCYGPLLSDFSETEKDCSSFETTCTCYWVSLEVAAPYSLTSPVSHHVHGMCVHHCAPKCARSITQLFLSYMYDDGERVRCLAFTGRVLYSFHVVFIISFHFSKDGARSSDSGRQPPTEESTIEFSCGWTATG